MTITVAEKLKLKGQGFIPQRDGEHFSCRVITENGFLNSRELQKIAEISHKYGNGEVCFTVRLTVEIPWIKYNDIENVKNELSTINLYSGGTGDRVRPIVSCKGLYCKYGSINTKELAKEIHDKFYLGFYDKKLPHKFKIAVGGCPNNCVKPDLNDIGIVGQRKPYIDKSICRGCKNCTVISSCKMGALSMVDGKLVVNHSICNNCGICISAKCNFDAISCEKEGFKLYLGGKWGRNIRRGNALSKIYSKDEILAKIEQIIIFYAKHGNPKERFGDMIDRIGFEQVKKEITAF